MKKSITILAWVIPSLFIYAGGDFGSDLSAVEGVSSTACKANTVYVEKDTQLMWEDQYYTDAEDGAYRRNHSVGKVGTWNDAKNYCASLNYKGFYDWRLPTSSELMHVHRKSGQVFKNYRGEDFWTSSPATDSRYYVVYTADAYQYKRKKKESNYVRCVRCLGEEVGKPTLLKLLNKKYKSVSKEADTFSENGDDVLSEDSNFSN